jgi:hypothetical protein
MKHVYVNESSKKKRQSIYNFQLLAISISITRENNKHKYFEEK